MTQPYEIYIAYMGWEGGGKFRPVLVVAEESGFVRVFQITTKFADKSETAKLNHYPIIDWKQAGLHQPSYVDIYNEYRIPVRKIRRPIGHLSPADKRRFLMFIQQS